MQQRSWKGKSALKLDVCSLIEYTSGFKADFTFNRKMNRKIYKNIKFHSHEFHEKLCSSIVAVFLPNYDSIIIIALMYRSAFTSKMKEKRKKKHKTQHVQKWTATARPLASYLHFSSVIMTVINRDCTIMHDCVMPRSQSAIGNRPAGTARAGRPAHARADQLTRVIHARINRFYSRRMLRRTPTHSNALQLILWLVAKMIQVLSGLYWSIRREKVKYL